MMTLLLVLAGLVIYAVIAGATYGVLIRRDDRTEEDALMQAAGWPLFFIYTAIFYPFYWIAKTVAELVIGKKERKNV